MMNTNQFINKANKIHNNFFDYSKVKYEKSNIPIIIICPKHGEFKQTPANHLRTSGCKKCGIEIMRNKLFKTNNEFIEKANKIHNNFYDYSKVDYKHSEKKVIIICPNHGEFEQIPANHLQGKGCKKCAIKSLSKIILKTTEQFINKANLVHNNFYEYSKTKYSGALNKIIIICPNHGEFEQTPNAHLQGNGCPN